MFTQRPLTEREELIKTIMEEDSSASIFEMLVKMEMSPARRKHFNLVSTAIKQKRAGDKAGASKTLSSAAKLLHDPNNSEKTKGNEIKEMVSHQSTGHIAVHGPGTRMTSYDDSPIDTVLSQMNFSGEVKINKEKFRKESEGKSGTKTEPEKIKQRNKKVKKIKRNLMENSSIGFND